MVTHQRYNPIAVYRAVLDSIRWKKALGQEVALAYTVAASITTPGEKQRVPPTQVVLKNAVLIVCKFIFRACIWCMASETENTGLAVPSG